VVVDGTRFPGGTGPIGPSGPIVNPSDPSGPLINPGTIGGTTFGGNTPWGPNVDPVQNYLDQIKGMRSFTGIGTQIVRSTADPTRAVVAGLQAKLLEETEFNGQQVEVWSTSAGLILTPLAARPAVDVGTRKGWTNPRIEATSRFAKWAVANAQDVSTAFNREEFQLKAFLEKFGSEKVEGGITITALLGDLPTGTTAKSPLDFVAVLAEANGKAIAREGFATETVIGSIGLDQKAEELTKTAPTTVKSIPSKAAKGLEQIGIKNLEGLRKAVPDKVSSKLAEIGVEAKAEEIAGWQAIAGTLIAVDKAARGTI
jgi:hypothetical protein